MTESPPTDLAGSHAENGEYGIVCRLCGGTRWKTTRTRAGWACVRRWRTCLGCRARIRTAERVESAGHPERDAG